MRSYWYSTLSTPNGRIAAVFEVDSLFFSPVKVIEETSKECNISFKELSLIFHKRISKKDYNLFRKLSNEQANI